MGKKNNVNPDHYKTAGRERQGDDIVQEIHKQEHTQAESARQNAGTANFIPGAAPVGESGSSEGAQGETGQTNESANSSSNT